MSEASEMIVLKPGLQTFHRSVFEGNKRIKTLTFVSGIPVELDDDEIQAIANDIGNTLAIALVNEEGKIRIDTELTHDCVVAIANDKLKCGIPLTPAQNQALDVDAAKKKAASKQLKQSKIPTDPDQENGPDSGVDPLAEIDEQLEALEAEIEALTGSVESAETDEIKQEIRKRVAELQAKLVQLNETRSAKEALLIQDDIRAAESELETLNAVIEDDQTSEEDLKQAKKEAAIIKRKITNASKSLEKLSATA